jgi:hypothetical protein
MNPNTCLRATSQGFQSIQHIQIDKEDDLLHLLTQGNSIEKNQAEAALLKAMVANLFPHNSLTPQINRPLTLKDVCRYIN